MIQRIMPLVLIRDRDGAELQADYDLKVQDRDTVRQDLQDADTRTKAILEEVCYSLQLQQSINQGDDITGRKLICQFYDYKDATLYHSIWACESGAVLEIEILFAAGSIIELV